MTPGSSARRVLCSRTACTAAGWSRIATVSARVQSLSRGRSRQSMYSRRIVHVQAMPGDKVPDASFSYFDDAGKLQHVTTSDLCTGKKIVLFAVPGAFLPTCSMKHLPGFINQVDAMKEKGVHTVACVSVNDAFVMDAWGKALGADGKVMMLSDGSAKFAKAMGADLDLTERNAGVRSRRYAMVIDNAVIKVLNLEEGGAYTISSAEDIMPHL